jgi:methyltransferase (TIGR00027 family)
MKRTQISTTAMGIAALEAIESEKPAGERIRYDPLARQFVGTAFCLLSELSAGYGERVAPGVQGFIVFRCRYFDDYLQERLRSGTDQVVILGARLNSWGYRADLLPRVVKIFEVDRPAIQASKIDRVKKAFGTIPTNVTLVRVDFNEETLDKLLSLGYDRSMKTLFICEGVTYYLNPEAVDATPAWVRANAATGSDIIFDYQYGSTLTTRQKPGEISRMQRYQRLTGEGLGFGIEKNQIEGFLTQRGFTHVEDTNAKELKRLYCTGPNLGRVVAEIYAIVDAEMEEGRVKVTR